jgi:hypothetical protein
LALEQNLPSSDVHLATCPVENKAKNSDANRVEICLCFTGVTLFNLFEPKRNGFSSI